MDLLGLVVEDRPLHRPLEELGRVAAEELVERVLARDVHGEARCCGARRAPTSAAATRPCPGTSRTAPRRGRRCRCRARARRWPRPPAGRPPRAAARSRAAARACSRRGRARSARRGRRGRPSSSRWRAKRWISSTPRRDFRKQIVRISRSTSAASRFAASPSAEARRPELLVHERRVPHRDLALGARGAVAVHELRPPRR